MPQKRLTMRKLKEVLRLASLGLSQHQIARSCSISQSTVHEYVAAAQAAGIGWPLPADWDDAQVERTLFPQRRHRRFGGSIPSRTGLGSTRTYKPTKT